jgi:hypothetical protein
MVADYTLKLKKGEIPLLFNTKMLKDYSISKKMEYEDLENAIISGSAFKVNDISDVLLMAHQTWCLYNSKACTYTELDACSWLDDTEALTPAIIGEIFLVFAAKVFRTTPEKLKELLKPVVNGAPVVEKKSLQENL